MAWARIGATADLLRGARPVWDQRRADGSPLHAAPTPALTTYPLDPVADPGDWEAPVVSFHDSPESLASAAFGIRVLPFERDGRPFDVPVGTLMLASGQHARALTALEGYLGVGLGPGLAFLLVQVRRPAGDCVHEALTKPPRRGFDRDVHLTRAGQRSEGMLRPGPRPRARSAKRLTAAAAQRYVDHYAEFGTHFISRVRSGDVLLQVFAFDRETLRGLRAGMGQAQDEAVLGDERALACVSLTAERLRAAAGPIISRSGDEALAESVAAGQWHDDRAGAHSLLAPFALRPQEVPRMLRPLTAVAPVEVELSPLNRFIEFYRAVNWQVLLSGALRQRYGPAMVVPAPASAVDVDPGALLPGPRLLPGQRERVYAERASAGTLAGLDAGGGARVLGAQLLALGAGERVSVPGDAFTLAARTIIAESTSTADGPTLVLSDAALDDFTLAADDFRGVLSVRNASRTAERTVIGGFVLATQDEGVCVEAAAHAPPPAAVGPSWGVLSASLRTAERVLAEGRHEQALATLAWVAALAAGEGPPADMGRRALALRWSLTRYPARGAERPSSEVEPYVRGVLEAAEGASHGDAERSLADARAAHEAFWHTADTIARRSSRRVRTTAETLAEAERALGPTSGDARGMLLRAAVSAVRGGPVPDMGTGLPAEDLRLEGPGGQSAAGAIIDFDRRVRATAEAIDRIEAEGFADPLAGLWDAAPPPAVDWAVFTGHLSALAHEAGEEFVTAATAARDHLEARADWAVVQASAEDRVATQPGPGIPASLLLAEAHVLRAQALTVHHQLAAPPGWRGRPDHDSENA